MKKYRFLIVLVVLLTSLFVSCDYYNVDVNSHKVTYNYNDGDNPVVLTCVVLDGSSATPISLSRPGYTFGGWCEDAEGTTPFDFSVALTEDVTLYANWTVKTFTITYKDKGDEEFSGTHGEDYPTSRTYGSDETALVNPEKDNYLFSGWYTTIGCSGEKVTSLTDLNCTSDITLYAKWEFGKGIAKATIGGQEVDRVWVQLWKDGPKFAEFNVGATIDSYSQANQTVSDTPNSGSDPLYCTANIGGYYQWGGTTNKDTANSSGTSYSSSGSDISCTGTIGTSTLGDTAKLIWGENWKMPKFAELAKLANYQDNGTTALAVPVTTWTWCDGTNTQYETGCTLKGWKVSGIGDYSNNSIFLPAAGSSIPSGSLNSVGTKGYYWTSTPDSLISSTSDSLVLSSSNPKLEWYQRQTGYPVRAILAD